MSVSIRSAREEDRTTLGALKLRSSLAWGDHVAELLALPEAREVPAEHLPHIIVAEFAGEIAGFVTILLENDDQQAELEDLFVAPDLWRKGIGKRLLVEAEHYAKVLGAHSLHVVAGKRAQAFYEAAGYKFTGTIATAFEPAAELLKDI